MNLTIIQTISIWILPLLFAITLHEVAHGWVASMFGDQTARLQGRLTINPIKHIDLMGTIIIPLLLIVIRSPFMFGWAKPVPVDSRNLRNPRYNMALVAAAGPIANFIMALIWGLIGKLGSNLDPWIGKPLLLMGSAGILINVMLAVLNCLPIPPLDGARVLYSLLPPRLSWYLYRLEPYGFIILILLMVTNVLYYILGVPVIILISAINNLFGL